MKRTPTMRIRFTEAETKLLNAVTPPPYSRLPPYQPRTDYYLTRREVTEMYSALSKYRTHLVGVLPMFERLNLSYTADIRNDIRCLERLDHDLRDILGVDVDDTINT